MSAELLSSKVVVQESPPGARALQGVSTSVGAMLGISQRGPIGEATLVTSEAEWRQIFGGDVVDGFASLAVRGFFENGGSALYFTRTVHYTDVSVASSKTSDAATLNLQTAASAASAGTVLAGNSGPYSLVPAGTLTFNIDGGGDDTATFDAARAARTAPGTGPYALSNNQTLTVKIDGGSVQTIVFLTGEFVAIGAATAAEVVAVINAKLSGGYADLNAGAPRINSDTQGTGSHVEVTGGTANTALLFNTAVVNGTGDVVDITAVTVAEIKTVVEADVTGVTVSDDGGAARFTSNTSGPSSSVLVVASSTLDDELGLDNATHSGSTGAAADTLQIDAAYDGTYGNDVTILIGAASSGAAAEFNLQVLHDGSVVEVFPNLTMDDDSDDYAEDRINGSSQYIAVTDLDVGGVSGSAASQRPANSPGSTPVPFGPLTGGDDGLAAIADTDFIGDDGAKTGLHSFDLVDASLLACPDRVTSAVQNAMLAYCEVHKSMSMFAVLDPPEGLTAAAMVTYVATTASLLGLSEFGAIYWPRIKVVNPSSAVFGSDDTVTVPPSGHAMGVYARASAARVGGVYDPPGGIANGRVFGAVGFETDEVLEEARRDLVYPKRINPISRPRNAPICLDGVRTLRGDGNFPTIGERRGAIFIEQTVKDGLEFARLRNNDESLRAEVNRTVTAFLLGEMRSGAFRSKDPATAFFVDTGTAINPPSEQFAGRLHVRVGIATQKPAEWIIVDFSQDTRALDEELAGG